MSTMQPAPGNIQVQEDPTFQKAADSIMQGLAVMYKLASQQPGRLDPAAITSFMEAIGAAEAQWNAPTTGEQEPMVPPDQSGMEDPSMMGEAPPMEGALPPEAGMPMEGEMPMPEGPPPGNMEDAAGMLWEQTQEDARRRGVR